MAISRILVVDDSPTERFFLSELLVKNGYLVSMAESGEEAVAQAKQTLPDLIVMDVVMPGITTSITIRSGSVCLAWATASSPLSAMLTR